MKQEFLSNRPLTEDQAAERVLQLHPNHVVKEITALGYDIANHGYRYAADIEPIDTSSMPLNLGAARFARADATNQVDPADALEAALAAIRSGELNPQHAIVLIAEPTERGAVTTRFYQGGSYNNHGQLGLLTQALFAFDASAD